MRLVYWLIALMAVVGVHAFELQCSSLREASFSNHVKAITCDVTNMNVTEKGTRMTSARKIADIDRVKGLRISYQAVHFMPKFLDAIAQRLERLAIYSCHLKMIDSDDLWQFPNLKQLRLSANDITSLPSNLFEFSEKLEFVGFNGNEIKFIGVNILQPLVNLKKADFMNSGCISMEASTPAQIETLKSKLLAKCRMEEQPNLTIGDEKTKQKVEDCEEQHFDLRKENARLIENIVELERKVDESQKKVSEVQLKLQQQFAIESAAIAKSLKVCDKILNRATRSLAPLLSHADSSSSDNQTVGIVCENFATASKVCTVTDLSIEKPATAIAYVKDKSGSDVLPMSLIIRQQPALFLPTNLAETFPNLTELEVSGSGIFIISRRSFEGLQELTNLNLTSNKILNIVNGSFSDMKKLAALDLSHNNIESIEFGAFKGLDVLKLLNLNGNKLKEIAAKFILPMKSLTSLDMLNNSCVNLKYPCTALEVIEAVVLENCTAPITINCAASNDSHVCHPENLRVEQLNVEILKIEGLSVGQSRADVNTLIIEDQVVNFLPQQLAQLFRKLEKLVVSRSQLSQLTKDVFVGFADLKWIEICGNDLTSIHAETFNAVPQLVHLDLSSNHIQSLPPKIFERLNQLKELRLSINDLKTFSANTLPSINAIKIFKVDHNKLEEIDPKLSKIFNNLDEIDMTNNTCIDAKYVKSDGNSTQTMRELISEIVLKC